MAAAPRSPHAPFEKRLVLNRYLLGLFGADSFEEFARGLTEPQYEEWDDDNVSQMFNALAARMRALQDSVADGPSTDDLRRYDTNIVSHTLRISRRRPQRVRWRYFQYLALLFAELYLDRFFTSPAALVGKLNQFLADLNARMPASGRIDPYTSDDLRKLAFWMATGSGKTLLMHVNILQYLHYCERAGSLRDLNRVILLTPNEGLSAQHLCELEASDLLARPFQKESRSVLGSQMVEIIDIHKLADEMGDKNGRRRSLRGKQPAVGR